MINFSQFFDKNLTVGGFPHTVNKKFDYIDYDIVINVSDEWLPCNYPNVYWFPMNECKKDIGLNSIYGAMVILRYAERSNLTAYLHCHAGVNRSNIVACSYYYMRTGKHLDTIVNERDNMLLKACSRGYLPPIVEMEKFLSVLSKKLKNYTNSGQLDICKLSINNF